MWMRTLVSRIPQCLQNWLPGRKGETRSENEKWDVTDEQAAGGVARCRHLRLWVGDKPRPCHLS